MDSVNIYTFISIFLLMVNVFVVSYMWAGLDRTPITKSYSVMMMNLIMANILAGLPHFVALSEAEAILLVRWRMFFWGLIVPVLLNYIYELVERRKDTIFWMISIIGIVGGFFNFFGGEMTLVGVQLHAFGPYAKFGPALPWVLAIIGILPLIYIIYLGVDRLRRVPTNDVLKVALVLMVVFTVAMLVRVSLTVVFFNSCIFFELSFISTILNVIFFVIYMKLGRTNFLRNQVEEKKYQLLYSQRRLNDVIQGADSIFWEIAPNLRITFSSSQSENILGYFAEEVEGRAPFELIRESDAEALKLHLQEIFSSKQPLVIDGLKVIRKDGGEVIFAVNGVPILDKKGELLCYRGTCRDVTLKTMLRNKLLDNESRLQAILDNTKALVYIKDYSGKYLLINRHYEKVLGASEYELIGKTDFQIYDEKYAREIRQNDLKIWEDKDSLQFEESIVTPVDGIKHTFVSVKFPLKNTSGEIYAIGGISTDITEFKEAGMEKERLQNQLFQSSRLASIGLLAAGVAHEINNPMVVIQAASDFIEDELKRLDIESPRINKFLMMQNESIERITGIVSKLSYYAKKDGREAELVNVHEVIDRTISIMGTIYRNSNINITKNFSTKSPIVFCKLGELQQVLMNIFTNAKDAMADRSNSTLVIKTSVDSKNVRIRVKDNGEGIEKENIGKVFDAFYTTKSAGKGTGLGLNITHSIVTEMRGTISLESKRGEGTEFFITLPRAREAGSLVLTEEGERKSLMDKFNGSVLLVDDDKSVCDVLGSYLRSYGLVVTTTNRGGDALEELKKNNFDLLLTDLLMPEMSGKTLIKSAFKMSLLKKTKVVVITGDISDHTGNIENEIPQISACLTKPFSRTKLHQILKSHLN